MMYNCWSVWCVNEDAWEIVFSENYRFLEFMCKMLNCIIWKTCVVFYHNLNVWNKNMWQYLTRIFAEVQNVTLKIKNKQKLLS